MINIDDVIENVTIELPTEISSGLRALASELNTSFTNWLVAMCLYYYQNSKATIEEIRAANPDRDEFFTKWDDKKRAQLKKELTKLDDDEDANEPF